MYIGCLKFLKKILKGWKTIHIYRIWFIVVHQAYKTILMNRIISQYHLKSVVIQIFRYMIRSSDKVTKCTFTYHAQSFIWPDTYPIFNICLSKLDKVNYSISHSLSPIHLWVITCWSFKHTFSYLSLIVIQNSQPTIRISSMIHSI